ncbi:hypothetical protein ACWDU8_34960 [Streptomyces sp. NPDC003388]
MDPCGNRIKAASHGPAGHPAGRWRCCRCTSTAARPSGPTPRSP